jgi:hypothetical protein
VQRAFDAPSALAGDHGALGDLAGAQRDAGAQQRPVLRVEVAVDLLARLRGQDDEPGLLQQQVQREGRDVVADDELELTLAVCLGIFGHLRWSPSRGCFPAARDAVPIAGASTSIEPAPGPRGAPCQRRLPAPWVSA